MHIMEGFLPPAHAIGWAAASLPFLAFGLRSVGRTLATHPEQRMLLGVAAAFAVNPVVGAAVFAASKALAPLWNKISVLRYHLSGPLDKPQIDEVLRKPREKSAK